MLHFSTKLIVSDKLNSEEFVKRVIEWVSGGTNYSFGDITWNQNEELCVENTEKTQKLEIIMYDNKETIAVHLQNKDGQVLWTNDYVLRSL